MPNQLKPLTNVEIAGAKPRSTDYELRDGEGLYLLVKTSGRKAWHFEYYHPVTKKRTKTSLGPYPVVTLAMARETRTKYRRLLYQGIDPRQHLAGIAEEKRIQNECTLEKVAEQWLKEKKRTSDLSEDHAKDVWRSLEMHVFPSLGNTPVTEIRPKMLKEHLTPLEEQGILETLRRVISRLNEIFRFAISEELIEFNPADNLVARFKKPKKQNMPALHPSEGRANAGATERFYPQGNPLPYRMGATDLGSPRRGRQRPLVRHRHEKSRMAHPRYLYEDEPFAHGAA